MAAGPKYPHVEVQLSGHDGNAFLVIGRVEEALRKANVSKEDRDNFFKEATSGDYDKLLQICMKYVSVS